MTTRKSKGSSRSDLERRILGGPLTVAAAVEGLRVGEGFSQAEFARKLGVSRQYLCDIEKGRLISPEQAARFAKAFGHPPTILVRLALQDLVRASGLKFRVSVEAAWEFSSGYPNHILRLLPVEFAPEILPSRKMSLSHGLCDAC